MSEQSVAHRFRTIVVGTDGSPSATETVEHAAAIARASGAVLHIVGAYSPATARDRLEALRQLPAGCYLDGIGDNRVLTYAILEHTADKVDDGTLRIVLHAVESDPARALCWVAECKAADLIVVGNRGPNGRLRRLRQAICEKVEERAPCPVLTVDTHPYWDDEQEASSYVSNAVSALAAISPVALAG